MTGARRGLPLDDAAPGGVAIRIGLVVAAVVLATLAAFGLEQAAGMQDASPVYLVAVVVAASLLGTWAAVATSVASFLAYDFLFTQPRFTLACSEARARRARSSRGST